MEIDLELSTTVKTAAKPLLKGRQAAILGFVAVFLVTFVVYRLTDGLETAFNGPVLLADALLHGRLDIVNGKELFHIDWAVYQGKYYVVEPAMTALVVLPGVVLYGTALNQTLVSTVIGALNAAVVYRLMRGLTEKIALQVALTVLFAFGTTYWWNANDGGIWYFSSATAVLFMFLAIHETLVSKRPFLAGLFLGAAYFARLPTVLALPFFVIMFSDQWLRWDTGRPLLQRLNWRPLFALGAGLAVFLGISFVYNYLRFDTPLPASYHYWMEYHKEGVPAGVLVKGLFDATYIPRHIPTALEMMPVFQSSPPYVLPSWAGMAIWVTTPAFLYALFAGIRGSLVRAAWLAAIVAAIAVAFLSARGIDVMDAPAKNLIAWPFAALILFGIATNLNNRLVLACWAAILPMAFTHFTVALTGWPQFGYRFALDYYPFLLLLTMVGMGDKLKWHHVALIGASVVISAAGVVWIHEFDPVQKFGYRWVTW
ncbi:MAG: hypothetical protein HYY03_07320 [Chloroflexi bacterium]|nr:hypothetical protein [Chloroflexota bacterium]